MLRFLTAATLIFVAAGLMLTASAQDSTYVRQLVVQVATTVEVDVDGNTTSSADINALNERFNLEGMDYVFRKLCPGHSSCPERFDKILLLTFQSPDAPAGAIGEYAALADVENVSLNGLVEGAAIPPNDPQYPNQWGLKNIAQPLPDASGSVMGQAGVDIGAEKAWTLGGRGSGLLLGVIDTGLDMSHPEFGSRVRSDLAWDFVNGDPDVTPTSAIDAHGTAVTGVAAASGDNGIGIAGVAWDVDIVPLKALQNGWGTWTNVADAIAYAAAVEIDVLNMSIVGGGPLFFVEIAIDYANFKDVVLVAAAGNTNSAIDFYPAAYPSVISVGAHSPCSERLSPSSCDGEPGGSSWGNTDIMAPGVFIATTDWQGANGYEPGDYTPDFYGTSVSTPFVAGGAILFREADPSLTAAQIRTLIQNTAVDMNTPGFDAETGYGRLNLGQAICDLTCPGPIVYVDQTALTGADNGATWNDAFLHLQDALAVARFCDVDEIRVAHGTYLPDWDGSAHTGDASMSFELVDDVDLLGGYSQGGSGMPVASQKPLTILSGDLSGDDLPNFANRGDNSLHAVRAAGITMATVMDGFAIQGGEAPSDAGAGFHIDQVSNLALGYLTIQDNQAQIGAGMYIGTGSVFATALNIASNAASNGAGLYLEGTASLRLTASGFFANTATTWGGAVHNRGLLSMEEIIFQANAANTASSTAAGGGGVLNTQSGQVRINRSQFIGNTAGSATGRGGALYNLNGATMAVANSVLQGNAAVNGGGAFIRDGTADFYNNTVIRNTAAGVGAANGRGGGMQISDGPNTPTVGLYNNIIWFNAGSSSPDVFVAQGSGVTAGTNMVGTCPGGTCVTGPPTLNVANALVPGSPGINQGVDADYLPFGISGMHAAHWDHDGPTRFVGQIDLGAFESVCPGPIAYVDLTATSGGNNGGLWQDAFLELQDALTVNPACGLEAIHVAEGTYLPDWDGSTHTGGRAMSFVLLDDVDLLGGFPSGGGQNQVATLKPLTILSGDLQGDDGSSFAQRGDNSVHVVRASGIANPTLMDGFLIRGGNADGSGVDREGAGMHVTGASNGLSLGSITFRDNEASAGGGLFVGASSIRGDDLTFSFNRGGSGGGLHISGDGVFELVIAQFLGNTGRGFGGAVHNRGQFEVEQAHFSRNVAGAQGGSAGGGGIVTTAGGYLWLNRSEFVGNRAEDDNGSTGRAGALYVLDDSSRVVVANTTFDANIADNGGAIFVREGTVEVYNVSAQSNTASSTGGFLHASDGTGIANVSIYNSILFDDVAPTDPEIHNAGPAVLTFGKNLIGGPCPGGTCMSAAPNYVSFPDHFGNSPAVNEGINAHYNMSFGKIWQSDHADFHGAHRFFGSSVDLGAVEHLAGPISAEEDLALDLPTQSRLVGNYPNPFNPSTSVVFELAEPSRVRLEVFDSLGRRVQILADGHLSAGTHERSFDASSLASGVYLYRMTVNGDAVVQVRPMLLLK